MRAYIIEYLMREREGGETERERGREGEGQIQERRKREGRQEITITKI